MGGLAPTHAKLFIQLHPQQPAGRSNSQHLSNRFSTLCSSSSGTQVHRNIEAMLCCFQRSLRHDMVPNRVSPRQFERRMVSQLKVLLHVGTYRTT